jgi:hypothetical protein
MYYQVGYGTTRADHYWYCAWENVYVASPDGSAVHASAKDKIRTVVESHMYRSDILPVDRPEFDRVLSRVWLFWSDPGQAARSRSW